MTEKDIYKAALLGLEVQRAEVQERIAQIQKRLNGQVFVLPSGQPCCPEHADKYQEDTCEVCAHLTGQNWDAERGTVAKRGTKPGFVMSKKTRMKMAAAQRRRWKMKRQAQRKA
jgi:predicted metal-dependent RNase